LSTRAYQPVSCVFHERLEFAALTGQSMRLLRLDEAAEEWSPVTLWPLDVYTRDGAEWLRCRDAGGSEALLRLDHLKPC
jgi:Rho-binding antiterminator